MSFQEQTPVPLIAFKNIVVTVTEGANDVLNPCCVETIVCTTPDTILNFQLAQQADGLADYRFDTPGLSGDVDQFGQVTISTSGKMMTVCNACSVAGTTINVTLNVVDSITPSKRGDHDPEVVNQPDGASRPR